MAKLNNVKQNSALIDEGVFIEWREYPGVFAKVRGFSYPPFQDAMANLTSQNRKRFGANLPASERTSEFAKLIVDHLLVDLQGLEDDNDKPVVLDDAFRERLKEDRDLRPILDFVTSCATEVDQRSAADLEKIRGNFETPPAGKKSGDKA